MSRANDASDVLRQGQLFIDGVHAILARRSFKSPLSIRDDPSAILLLLCWAQQRQNPTREARDNRTGNLGGAGRVTRTG